jgi:hypothetical protein
MSGTIGNIPAATPGGPADGVTAKDAGGSDDQQAQAFEQALGQFAMQIAGDVMDEMSQALSDTEEDFL